MKKLIMLIALCFAIIGTAWGFDVTLAWDQYADQMYSTGFYVKAGERTGGPYPIIIEVPGQMKTIYTILNFEKAYPAKEYYFIVTAYEVPGGRESPPSNEVVYKRPLSPVRNLKLMIK